MYGRTAGKTCAPCALANAATMAVPTVSNEAQLLVKSKLSSLPRVLRRPNLGSSLRMRVFAELAKTLRAQRATSKKETTKGIVISKFIGDIPSTLEGKTLGLLTVRERVPGAILTSSPLVSVAAETIRKPLRGNARPSN